MKKFVIRCTEPGHRTCYVQHIARDAGFVVTYDKAKARRMRLETARQRIEGLTAGFSKMVFDVSEVVL